MAKKIIRAHLFFNQVGDTEIEFEFSLTSENHNEVLFRKKYNSRQVISYGIADSFRDRAELRIGSRDTSAGAIEAVFQHLNVPRELIEDIGRDGGDFSSQIYEYSFPVSHVANPIRSDFFDELRELKTCIENLCDEIRTTNDVRSRAPEVLALRAYLLSILAFIDEEFSPGDAPPVPESISEGAKEGIKKVDWSAFSENSRKWAETIFRIVDGIFK